MLKHWLPFGLAGEAEAAPTQEGPRRAGLGTFGGVFAPSILTILGIILFLRHGWVVGRGGLWMAFGLVALAHTVSILTSVSLAAIATNRRVKGGGDYFLISRSLGPEFGGSLGLVLFLAQSVSVAFYCFGFGEAAASLLDGVPFAEPRNLAMLAGLMLFGIAFAGADLATRFQYGIMAVMGAALLSFFWGAIDGADARVLAENLSAPADSPGFWALFAIFFPAVTGFTQGVSMSGDLAEPGRSLPRGTFLAVGTSLVVYTVTAVLFAANGSLESLAADYQAFARVSALSFLFHAGVIAATLSSALASFLGAPRILQALSRDQIFGWLAPFGVGSGAADNPRRAVILTGVIATGVFLAGDLNAVARIISMFFLISYGLLNWATWVEAHGASPIFRPRFRFFHARVSLVGSLICLGAMLAIDLFSGLVALGVMFGLYRYLRSREIPVAWADSRPAYNARKLKETLNEIARTPLDDWNWLPNLIVYGEDAERRDLLVRYGSMFTGASGFTTSLGLVEAEGDLMSAGEARAALEESLRQEIESQQLDAFPLAVAAPDLRVAISTVLQTWGMGPVRANTVLLDWLAHVPEDASESDPKRYARRLQSILRLGCHVLVLDVSGRDAREVATRAPEERTIDVWWFEDATSRLGLLLAYMMTRSEFWEEATIRLLAPCAADEERKVEGHLEGLLREARIEAEVVPVPGATARDLVERSRDVSMVFLPMDVKGMTVVGPFEEPLDDELEALPICCLVAAASGVRLSEPEEDPAERFRNGERSGGEADAERGRNGNGNGRDARASGGVDGEGPLGRLER